MKTNRLKELEKIAEKLGIGQNREVECISCHQKIQFKDAIIITNKKTVSYLCAECNEKLTKGGLKEKEIGDDEIMKQLDKWRKQGGDIQPVPYEPKIIPWEPYYPTTIKDVTWRLNDIEYKVYTSQVVPENTMLLKFEPK
jgi:hypothetical protein